MTPAAAAPARAAAGLCDSPAVDLAEPETVVAAGAIADVAAALRRHLTPLLQALAGTPPRPVRLTRAGLDKSLASRLVQATRAQSDLEFLHAVPSPTGLRILLERARGQADAVLLQATAAAVDRFEALLDGLPGGRQALDARIGESQNHVRERREQTARQASFKAQSFLFGHYCETLSTALFLVPSADGDHVDLLEVHRRLGLQRLSAGTALPLLSVQTLVSEAADRSLPTMSTVEGDRQTRRPHDFLIAEASSLPLPALQVNVDGPMSTFVLNAAADGSTPARLTSAFRMQRAERLRHDGAYTVVRNYMLHTPCRTLVRDLFIARGLWPDAWPQVGFYLPGPTGTTVAQPEPGQPHLRRVNLTARIEQLPLGAAGFVLDGVADQPAAMAAVLQRAGLAGSEFRGWRCRMTYPVPLIEMQVAFRFGGMS